MQADGRDQEEDATQSCIAGCLTDPVLVAETFRRGIEGLLTYRTRDQHPTRSASAPGIGS